MKEQKIVPRFPRGLGITQLALQANAGDDEALKNLTKFIVHTWIVNNGKLWSRVYSVNELADFLKCEPAIIQMQMKQTFLDNGLFDRNKMDEIADSLMGACIGWALEDRMEISQQLQILRDSHRSIHNAKKWNKFILTHLEPNTDAIISLSTIPVAYLKTNIPIFIYIDGIYEYMLEQGFYKLINNTKEAHKIEQNALDNCSQIITSSTASAEAIKSNYKIDPKKISVIPLGANIDTIPDETEIINNIKHKSMEKCKILFVGVDWERKGTDIVIQAVEELYKVNSFDEFMRIIYEWKAFTSLYFILSLGRTIFCLKTSKEERVRSIPDEKDLS